MITNSWAWDLLKKVLEPSKKANFCIHKSAQAEILKESLKLALKILENQHQKSVFDSMNNPLNELIVGINYILIIIFVTDVLYQIIIVAVLIMYGIDKHSR